MKRNLSLLLALTMLLGLLAGCSMKPPEPMEDDASHNDKNDAAPEDPKNPQPASGEKDAEQYLNVLLTDEPSVLDVARFLGVTDRNLFMNLKEPLVRIENGEIVGELGYLRRRSDLYLPSAGKLLERRPEGDGPGLHYSPAAPMRPGQRLCLYRRLCRY